MLTSDSQNYELIDQLAEEFVDRLRRGERPSIEEYCSRHPQIADDLRKMLPALVEVERVKSEGRTPLTVETPKLRQVGEYTILREVGRGGMGVVYEAEQVTLRRRVALKVLAGSKLGNGVERFKREARAAARLHHTNIVPIFGVGDHEGTPFYVMQFIQGLGLDEVLKEVKRLQARTAASGLAKLPEPLNVDAPYPEVSAAAVALSLVTGAFQPAAGDEMARTLTNTIQPPAADTAGDPPGDLSSPTSGSTGDALRNRSSSASSISLPGTSSQAGRKPSYEQSVAQIGLQVADALEYAHKQGILHRDIKPSNLLLDLQGVVWVADFGLAKTEDQENLTHTGDILGTLRYMPPEAFDGRSDARSDVYSLGMSLYELLALRPAYDERQREQLMKQVTTTLPPRLGSLNKSIPRDLQTIVHKAIEKNPDQRYQSAGELAADLRRFVSDVPILARRVGPKERFTRWCRRNPTIAGSICIVVLIFLSAFAAVNVALWKARQAETLAETRRKDAERNEQEARFQKEQADIGFARARQAVDDYLNQVTESEALKSPGLQPLRRDLLGSALKFYEHFVTERADDAALRAELAIVHLRVARIYNETANQQGTRSAAQAAVKLFEQIAADAPNDEVVWSGLVEAYTLADEPARAIAAGEPVASAHPDFLQVKHQLAEAYNALGLVRTATGDHLGVMEAYERSLRFREELFRRDPSSPANELGVASALNNLGALLSRFDRHADALVLYRHSLEHARHVFSRRPRDFSAIRLIYRGLNNSSRIEEELGLFDEAFKTNLEGLELSQRLLPSDPDVPEHAYFCYQFAAARADWLTDRKREVEALAAYKIATEMSASPQLRHFKLVSDRIWIEFALQAVRHSVLLGKLSVDPNPKDRAEQERLAALAVAHLRRGYEAGFQNVNILKTNREWDCLRPRQDFQDLLLWVQNRKEVVEEKKPTEPELIVAAKASAATSAPAKHKIDGDSAVSHYAIGMFEMKFGLWEKAEKTLSDVCIELEAILRADPTALRYELELGRSLIALGDLYRDKYRLPEALRSWQAGRDHLLSILKKTSGQDALAVEAGSLLGPLGVYYAEFLPSEAEIPLTAARNTEFANTPWGTLQHGVSCLVNDDTQEYLKDCEKMFRGFPNKYDANGWFSADVAVLCALDPKKSIRPEKYLRLAERGVQVAQTPFEKQYRNGYLALAYLRAGRLPKALDCLDSSDRFASFGHTGIDTHTALSRAIRSLVLHRLGRVGDSKKALTQAKHWHAVLEQRLVVRPPSAIMGAADALVVDLVRLILREASLEIAQESYHVERWQILQRAAGEVRFGRPDRARAELEKLNWIEPLDSYVLAARGFLRAQLGDVPRAQVDCQEALKIDPDLMLAHYGQAVIAMTSHRPADAAASFDCVLKHLPSQRAPEAPRFAIDAMLANSDEMFQKIVELRPNDPQLWVARGRALAWKERWHEAAQAYGRVVASQTIFVDWAEYGYTLILAGDWDGYRALCSKLFERMKTPVGRKGEVDEVYTIEIALQLASVHPGVGIDMKKVQPWIDLGLKMNPSAGEILFGAGMASERSQKFADAIRYYHRALKNEPMWEGRHLNWYGLAISHARLGQFDEARRWFEQAESAHKTRLALAANMKTIPTGYYIYIDLAGRIRSSEARKLLSLEVATGANSH